jgi:hypothetical protein
MRPKRRVPEERDALGGWASRMAGGRRVNEPDGHVRKRLRQVAGYALLVLGAMGIVFPMLPGIPLLIAGAALLGSDHPAVRPLLDRLKGWRTEGNKARRRAGRTDHTGGEARTLGHPAPRHGEERHR